MYFGNRWGFPSVDVKKKNTPGKKCWNFHAWKDAVTECVCEYTSNNVCVDEHTSFLSYYVITVPFGITMLTKMMMDVQP